MQTVFPPLDVPGQFVRSLNNDENKKRKAEAELPTTSQDTPKKSKLF